jgi:hypothetical protein
MISQTSDKNDACSHYHRPLQLLPHDSHPIMDSLGLPLSFGKHTSPAESSNTAPSPQPSEPSTRGETAGRGSRGIVGGGKRKRGRGGPNANQDGGWPDRSNQMEDTQRVRHVPVPLPDPSALHQRRPRLTAMLQTPTSSRSTLTLHYRRPPTLPFPRIEAPRHVGDEVVMGDLEAAVQAARLTVAMGPATRGSSGRASARTRGKS